MTQKLLFLITLILLMGCTTSKWTVVDEYAVDENEKPRLISEDEQLLIDDYPTVENPILRLAPYKVIKNEYSQRILVERAVQQYRPRWGFALLALSGSAFAIAAANSDLLIADPTRTQRIGLTLSGGLLGVLAFTNLKEVGEPILTDEKQYLRSTATTTRIDTVLSMPSSGSNNGSVEVRYKGKPIFEDQSISLSNNSIDLNVGSFADQLNQEFDDEAEIVISANYENSESIYSVPVDSFLETYFVIQEPVTQVRNNPSISSGNIVVELGEESELLKLDDHSSDWVEVQYAGQEAYISRESGVPQWRSRSDAQSALLVELTEVPFGEIDVENSLPILKSRNENDRAIIFSNIEDNQIGSRQPLNRGHQLFERYMRTSLQMNRNQILKITEPEEGSWKESIGRCTSMDGGTLSVFLTGFAQIKENEGETDLVMTHVNPEGEQTEISVTELFKTLADCDPDKLFIFADLEYTKPEADLLEQVRRSNGARVQQVVANRLVDDFPEAVVIFGNSINQRSSAFRGSSDNDKQHYIFTYYLAEALKQRKTRMSELVNHLENNVDYTSRRLHDRAQDVRAFGNFSLNIAE